MIVDMIASTKPSGDNTLKAAIGKEWGKALEGLKLTKEYREAEKRKDTEAIKALEDAAYKKILRGFDTFGGSSRRAVSFNDLPD